MTPTPPTPPHDPGAAPTEHNSVWPPPPAQTDSAPAHAPFSSLLPLSFAVTALMTIQLFGLIGTMLMRSDPLNTAAVLLRLIVIVSYGGAYIAGRMLFLRWVFVAYKNLDAFETAGLETTPGWAVGWFFVPIVNLYRPYMIFHELWKAGDPAVDSRDEIEWQQTPSSPLLGWWWTALILDIFLPLMASKVLTHGLTDAASSILKIVLSAASVILTIVVVALISRRQEAKAKALEPTAHSYF